MRQRIFQLMLLLSAVAACVTTESYDFRSQDRPTYDRVISIDELDEWSDGDAVTLLDVRLLEDFQANPVLISGATYNNPDQIETWSSALPENSRVVVYCVRGAWVSQKAATYLSDKGIDVYTLAGGIEAWQKKSDN